MLNREVDKHKKRVLEVLLTYTFIAGMVFALLNFSRNLIVIASIELIAGLISLLIFYHVKKAISHEKLIQLTVIYLTLFFSVMLFIFSSKGVSTSIFVWVYTIPLISYLLLGSHLGFVFTLVLYSISAIIFFKNPNYYSFISEKVAIGNVLFSALVLWGLSHIYEKTNAESKALLKQMAIFDTLTGLHNRSLLKRHFKNSSKIALKENLQISMIVFDLDKFKNINDQFGHAAGDEVLVGFSSVLINSLPDNTTAFRLGGEEFAVVLLTTTIEKSIKFAESIRKKCEMTVYNFQGQSVQVTVSVGIVITQPQSLELSQMLKVADKRLYVAKSQGRNTVIYKN